MSLENLVEMSRRYGGNEDYVLAGGGNTSYKENGVMYVKGSGTRLSEATPEQFVAMDVQLLREMIGYAYPPDMSDGERDAAALTKMMAARLSGEETKRPSVEALLHALFPHKFVLHVHPALVNGMTCGAQGEAICRRLFGDKAVWIGLTRPGLILAQTCNTAFKAYTAQFGIHPQIVFLENHGIFVAADTVNEIDFIMDDVTCRLMGFTSDRPDMGEAGFDRELVCSIAPVLRMRYSGDGAANVLFCVNKQVLSFISGENAWTALLKPFTPDQIVYCKDEPLLIGPGVDISSEFMAFASKKGYKPRIVAVSGLGFFALGNNLNAANQAKKLFLDAMKIAVYGNAFGGAKPLPDEFTEFILNWEAEQYRSKVSMPSGAGGRLSGRIAIVTGAAQGFGKGIAEALAREGSYVAIADLNYDGALSCAAGINASRGHGVATAVCVDVSDEESVKHMVQETVLAFGGLDVFISNAGVLIAGGLDEMTKEKFNFVTNINYTGYFLCAKYASAPMKIQSKYAAPGYMTDIIEINSKSGLEGSKMNFAYSGGKFGGIGLTQSFAMELAEYGVKVNAICPGNLLDGPLWSDPVRGLFRQYLDSGKVKGAKTIDDVRRYYTEKVPLKRGCDIEDVVRAVFYVIEQQYETGQAVPVTGGQIMLR